MPARMYIDSNVTETPDWMKIERFEYYDHCVKAAGAKKQPKKEHNLMVNMLFNLFA